MQVYELLDTVMVRTQTKHLIYQELQAEIASSLTQKGLNLKLLFVVSPYVHPFYTGHS
jgi:ribosomal protein L31